MNTKTRQKINEINKQFYKKYEKEFSISRQYPWNGWAKVINQIKTTYVEDKGYEKLSVLDIGCGNGRFLKFLDDNLEQNVDKVSIEYIGIDTNEYLLEQGKKQFPKSKFLKLDVIEDIKDIGEKANVKKFDLVVAFGIAHHLPGAEYRLQWFKQIAQLLNPNGLLVITMWNPHDKDRFAPIAQEANSAIKELLLEKGDLFLGWDNSSYYPRYVHKYDETEISNIVASLLLKNVKLISSFKSDGKTGDLNLYLLFQLKP